MEYLQVWHGSCIVLRQKEANKMAKRNMKLLKEGDKLYTGKIVSKLFAEQYNFLSDYIQKKEEAGFDAEVENWLNAKHKFFVIYANLKKQK
jgi:hypothetical protein